MMRKSISIILLFAFAVLSVSGIQLSLPDKEKMQSIQKMSAVDRPFYPKKAHEYAGYIFIGAGIIHLSLNIKAMKSYFKSKKK